MCGDDPPILDTQNTPLDVNPACAGMIPRRTNYLPVVEGKPRVCGDDPLSTTTTEPGTP